MYRILAENHELRERRDQLRHPVWVKPQLVATAPNQLWSWDITRLLTLVVRTFYYLYVVLDVYSCYVVGWLLAEQESTELAQQLIAATCDKQGIRREQLTLHADHGSPMIAHSLEQLLSDLGVSKTHRSSSLTGLPATRLGRQSVLRGAVQNAQIPPGFPSALWLGTGCQGLAADVLWLVQ
jgi:putative transposase